MRDSMETGSGLVVRVLDFLGLSRVFDPHTGHGSLLKLRQFHLPQFASVYSAANEYQQSYLDLLYSSNTPGLY